MVLTYTILLRGISVSQDEPEFEVENVSLCLHPLSRIVEETFDIEELESSVQGDSVKMCLLRLLNGFPKVEERYWKNDSKKSKEARK